MYFNVSQLMREPSGSHRDHRVDGEVVVGKDEEEYEVTGSVDLLRTDRGVWASASLDSRVSCVCSRCLRNYSQLVKVVIEEEFYSREGSGDGRVGYRRSESYQIDQDQILDLTDAVLQYISIGVPMKPVCRDSCAGICGACGVNLNGDSCQCKEIEGEVGWRSLAYIAASSDAKWTSEK